MGNNNILSLILSGLGTNILVVALSAVLPLLVGIGLTVLMHVTRKSPLPKVFRYVAILTEGLVPLLLFYNLFYIDSPIAPLGGVIPIVVTLTICYLGYMVFRYEERDSLVKNIVVNGIGLVAGLFKWSFICSNFAVYDLLKNMQLLISRTYEISYYIIPLLVAFGVLSVLYLARQLCKDLMK